MSQEEEEGLEEDMDALRVLLENIITLSFDEEKLMHDISQTDDQDPTSFPPPAFRIESFEANQNVGF